MSDIDPIKIPFEFSTEQLSASAAKLEANLNDVDASVAKAKANFSAMNAKQLQTGNIFKQTTATTQNYTSSLELLKKQLREINDPKLQQLQHHAMQQMKQDVDNFNKSTNQVGAAKSQFNGLGNSINQITRELPAFAISAQTGFMAISNNIPMLADEIERLSAKNKELAASGQKTVPVWKTVVKNLFSWQSAMSLGIVLITVFGKEIGKWIANLIRGNRTLDEFKESRKALSEAFRSNDFKKATLSVIELSSKIKMAKNGFYDKRKALEEYNKSLGKTVGKAKNLAEAEKWLIDNKNKYVEMVLYKATATKLMEKAAQKQVDAALKTSGVEIDYGGLLLNKITSGNLSGTIAGYIKKQKKDAERAKKDANSLTKIAEDFIKKQTELEKELGITFTPSPDKEVNARKNLLEKLEALDKEYARKSMSSDEQELQALRDKFAKIRAEIEKYNKQKNAVKIDLTQLDNIQSRAESDLIYRQQTEALKKELEVQKQMYAAFENYKEQLGENAAKQLENNLPDFENYGALLQSEIDKLNNEVLKNNDKKAIGVQAERLKFLYEQLAEYKNFQNNLEKQQFAEAYQYAVLHEEKLLQLKQNYEAQKRQLEKIEDSGLREKKLNELKGLYNQELEALRANAYEKTKLYEELSQNLVGITKRELQNRIDSLREYLQIAGDNLINEQKQFIEAELQKAEALQRSTDIGVQEAALLQRKAELQKNITEKSQKGAGNVKQESEELEAVNAELEDIEARKFEKFASAASELSSSFHELGDEIGYFDEGIGDAINQLADLVGMAGQAANAIGAFASGNIIGGITSSIGLISKVFSMKRESEESERKAQEELKKWHDAIFQSQLDYNRALREQVNDEIKLNDIYQSRLDVVKEQINANNSAKKSINNDIEKVWSKLLKSKTVIGKSTSKTGGFLGTGWGSKTVTKNIDASIEEILKGVDASAENFQDIFSGKFMKKISVDLLRAGAGIEDRNITSFSDEMLAKIEKINAASPLSGDAKKAFEQLKKLKKEYGSIEEAQRQLQLQLEDTHLGFDASALANSITQGIKSGKKSFKDFAEDIEGFLQQAIISGMSAKVIEPQMKALQDKLYSMLGDGVLTEDEKKEWQNAYMKVVNEAKEYSEMMNQASVTFGDKDKKSPMSKKNIGSLKGAVKGITEQQADLLAGEVGGLRITQAETNVILRNGFAQQLKVLSNSLQVQKNIELNTRKTAENTKKLHEINTNLKVVSTAIKSNKNTLKSNGL